MKRLYLLFILLLVDSTVLAEQPPASNSIDVLIGEMKEMESNREPKCYATASRLEDFMYGTALSSEARFKKIELQKILILDIWRKASERAEKRGAQTIGKDVLTPILQSVISYAQNDDGGWTVTLPGKNKLIIDQNNQRQYSSIAYALRAILAVQQDVMMDPETRLLTLDEGSSKEFQEFLDILALSALKIADKKARITHQYEITAENFSAAWSSIIGLTGKYQVKQQLRPTARSDFKLIKKIINQKIASYQAYNHISAKVFLRNLQVYFAKRRWPADPEIGKQFKILFAQAMTQYANDLTLGAERVAMASSHPLIRVADVNQFAQAFVPHRINQYEDAIFFPNLPLEERVVIESYDMDAFRDSGIHWLYLQSAIESVNYRGVLEPDPFAAELLVENIAQYGVLLLRATGMVAKLEGSERLLPDHIEKGFRLIQDKIKAHANVKPTSVADMPLSSSGSIGEQSSQQTFFTDVTHQVGVDFMHRSSDWLNRLIRSYAMKSKNVGQLTIPPAFGGSGVAADDINGDGLPDILILSGLGNKLFLNNGKSGFTDITLQAGLDWRRADGTAGEPRQPIIADFDNDGLQDIFITYVDDDHRLYRNLGDNRFEDITRQSGLGGKRSGGWAGGGV